jgi:hypothetical protein
MHGCIPLSGPPMDFLLRTYPVGVECDLYINFFFWRVKL